MKRSLDRGIRFVVLRRDAFTCQYCGAKAPNVEIQVDHVIPVSRGGSDSLDNLVTACKDCNVGKYNVPAKQPKHIPWVWDRSLSFSDNIIRAAKWYMANNGMTEATFAKLAGIPPPHVNALLKYKARMTWQNIDKLAHAAGVTTKKLARAAGVTSEAMKESE